MCTLMHRLMPQSSVTSNTQLHTVNMKHVVVELTRDRPFSALAKNLTSQFLICEMDGRCHIMKIS